MSEIWAETAKDVAAVIQQMVDYNLRVALFRLSMMFVWVHVWLRAAASTTHVWDLNVERTEHGEQSSSKEEHDLPFTQHPRCAVTGQGNTPLPFRLLPIKLLSIKGHEARNHCFYSLENL